MDFWPHLPEPTEGCVKSEPWHSTHKRPVCHQGQPSVTNKNNLQKLVGFYSELRHLLKRIWIHPAYSSILKVFLGTFSSATFFFQVFPQMIQHRGFNKSAGTDDWIGIQSFTYTKPFIPEKFQSELSWAEPICSFLPSCKWHLATSCQRKWHVKSTQNVLATFSSWES